MAVWRKIADLALFAVYEALCTKVGEVFEVSGNRLEWREIQIVRMYLIEGAVVVVRGEGPSEFFSILWSSGFDARRGWQNRGRKKGAS